MASIAYRRLISVEISKPLAKMTQSTSYSTPSATMPVLGQPFHALGLRHVDERDVGAVEGGQVLLAGQRPLAHEAVVRLERLGGRRDRRRWLGDAATQPLHDLVVFLFADRHDLLDASARRDPRWPAIRAVMLRPSSVQKSHTRSGSPNTTPTNGDQLWKLRLRSSCQPGCSDAAHSGSVGGVHRGRRPTTGSAGTRRAAWHLGRGAAPAGRRWRRCPTSATRLSASLSSPPSASPPV